MTKQRPLGVSLLAVSNVLLSTFLVIGGALVFSVRNKYQISAGAYIVLIPLALAVLALAFVCGVAGVDLWRLRKRGRPATIFFMCIFGLLGANAALLSREELQSPQFRESGWTELWLGSAVAAYCLWAAVYLLLPKTRRKFEAAAGSAQPEMAASDHAGTPAALRWSRLVAISSLGSAVCIIAAYSIQAWGTVDWLPGLLFISPVWLPFLFIPSRLRGERIKSGLALAIAMGGALFAPAVAVIYYAHEWEASLWIQGCLALLLLTQPVLVSAAIRAYKFLPAAPRDGLKLAVSTTYGVLLFAAFWLFVGFGNFPSPIAYNEHSAMESMRAAYMAANVYARDHGGFYPENRAAWRPGAQEECKAYGWPSITSNQADDGYSFDYRGDSSDQPGHRCRMAKTYEATARPVVFGRTGRRSFFVDQTGVIRFTLENRAATASDPRIPPESLPPL